MGNLADKQLGPQKRFDFKDPPLEGNKYAVPPQYTGIDFYKALSGKDDENVLERARIMTKWTLFCASIQTLLNTYMLERTERVYVTRMALHYGVPWIGGGLVYIGTVSAVASLRKKDDTFNHLCGGFAAASFVATKCQTIQSKCLTGFTLGLTLAFIGMWYKSFHMQGWIVFPEPRNNPVPQRYTWWGHLYDGHRLKDKPYNWVAAPPDEKN